MTVSINQFLDTWHETANNPKQTPDKELRSAMTRFAQHLQDGVLRNPTMFGVDKAPSKNHVMSEIQLNHLAGGKTLSRFNDSDQKFVKAAAEYLTAKTDEDLKSTATQLQDLGVGVSTDDKSASKNILNNELSRKLEEKFFDSTYLADTNLQKFFLKENVCKRQPAYHIQKKDLRKQGKI